MSCFSTLEISPPNKSFVRRSGGNAHRDKVARYNNDCFIFLIVKIKLNYE